MSAFETRTRFVSICFILLFTTSGISQQFDARTYNRVTGFLDLLAITETQDGLELSDQQLELLKQSHDKLHLLREMIVEIDSSRVEERRQLMASMAVAGLEFEASLNSDQHKKISQKYYSSQVRDKGTFALTDRFIIRNLGLSKEQQLSIQDLIDEHEEELVKKIEEIEKEIREIRDEYQEKALRILSQNQRGKFLNRFVAKNEPDAKKTGADYAGRDEEAFEMHRVRWISNTFVNKTFQKRFEIGKDQLPEVKRIQKELIMARKEIAPNSLSEENSEKIEAFRSLLLKSGKSIDEILVPRQLNDINFFYHMTFVKDKSFFGLTDPFVSDRVGISEQQQAELKALAKTSGPELQEKMQPLRAKALSAKVEFQKQLLKILTPSQREDFVERFGHILAERQNENNQKQLPLIRNCQGFEPWQFCFHPFENFL